MAQSLVAILSLLVILLISAGFGRTILAFASYASGRAFRPEAYSIEALGLKGLLFSVGTGLGALSYFIMILGLLGVLYPSFALLVLFIMANVSLKAIRDIIRECVTRASGRKTSPEAYLAAAALSVIGVCALIGALAPPGVNDWDTLAYHFAVPKLYIDWHAIKYVPFTSHSNLPFLMEMLYTIGLMFPAAGGAVLAKLFHLAMALFTMLAVYSIGKKHFSPRAGMIAAVVFASIPLVGWEATNGYIDLGASFYVTLAVLALLYHWREGGKWGVFAAITLGLAAATKTTALIFIPLAAVWLVCNELRRGRGLRQALLQSVGLSFLAFLIASPWYIKSWVYTGNPVYPFLYDTFGGRNWNAHLAEAYRASQLQFGMGESLYSFLLAPWNLTMYPARFFDCKVIFASIGPVFLAALPLFAAIRFGGAKLRMLLAFIAASVVIWFFMTQQSRYLIPAMALGAVAIGALVEEMRDLRIARTLLFIAIAAGLAWAIMINGRLATLASPGVTAPETYLMNTLDIYPASRYINDKLPPDAKVILFRDTRGYYLDREYLWGDDIHHTLIPYDRFRNAADMTHFLHRQGITHSLVNFGLNPVPTAKPRRSEVLMREAIAEGHFRPEFRSERAGVFSIRL